MQKPVLFVQDTVHLAVKLKSRLLNLNVTLKMGPNCEAEAYHLVTLRTKVGKEEHFLRERDINHKDGQNFDAVMHIINAAHLLDRITGAAATKCYIELIQNITDSYLDKSLDPIARVEKIWYANFFIRYWRQWILLHPQFTLRSNFITHNCYMCVELNAHAMIVYIMLIRDHFHSNWNCFVPWVLGSQTCEKTFRTVRSMSTAFSSTINFSILGLLHRLHRINIQLTLQATLKEIVFPSLDWHCAKEGKNLVSNKPLSAIRDADIANAIDHAKTKARNTLEIH